MKRWAGAVVLVVGSVARGAAATRPVEAPAGYHVVFDDEFDGAEVGEKWSDETGMVRNHEAQLYTSRQNARVEGGNLVIEARREEVVVPGKKGKVAHYTSASLVSAESWRYGRVEVRAKIPGAVGTWPAIWFLGDSVRTGTGWPLCGEIDLMEHVGHDPDRIHQSVHTGAYNWVKKTQKTAITKVPRLDTDFHVYAMEWSREKVEMFIDGVRRFTFANEHQTEAEWPFDGPMHLKLNLAIGGDWGGQKGIDDKAFPQRFVVDYVRVYQQDGQGR